MPSNDLSNDRRAEWERLNVAFCDAVNMGKMHEARRLNDCILRLDDEVK
jgi:hypothetical protein